MSTFSLQSMEPKLKSNGKSTCQPKIILSLFMVFDSTDQVKLNQIVKKNPNNSVDSSSGVQNEGRSKPTKQPPPTRSGLIKPSTDTAPDW